MSDKNSDEEMQPEYDFSNGIPNPYAESYRAGHSIRVTGADGMVEEHFFTLQDGAVMLDPDVRKRFPDSKSVNNALRDYLSRHQ